MPISNRPPAKRSTRCRTLNAGLQTSQQSPEAAPRAPRNGLASCLFPVASATPFSGASTVAATGRQGASCGSSAHVAPSTRQTDRVVVATVRLDEAAAAARSPSCPLKSLALIGNASAVRGRIGAEMVAAEAFSIRRLGGSRWRLRRTRPMGIGYRSGTGLWEWAATFLECSGPSGKENSDAVG
jgi:hypothetical protein